MCVPASGCRPCAVRVLLAGQLVHRKLEPCDREWPQGRSDCYGMATRSPHIQASSGAACTGTMMSEVFTFPFRPERFFVHRARDLDDLISL